LEWAKHQLVAYHAVEPRPPESHRLVNGRSHIAHNGYQVLLALNERRYLAYQQLVLFFFHVANLRIISEIRHRNVGNSLKNLEVSTEFSIIGDAL
jgi:hypothetical protein